MGDVRFRDPYRQLEAAEDRRRVLHEMSDDAVIQALAHASREKDPLLANVLATEAHNRMRRAGIITYHMAEGIFSVDPDLLLTFANRAMMGMLGLDGIPVGSKHFDDIVELSDETGAPLASDAHPLRRVLSEGCVLEDEFFIGPRGGEQVFASIIAAPIVREGEVEGVVGAVRDLTERRRLGEWLDLALRAVGMGAWDWDLRTGRVEATPMSERLWGYPVGEFPGTFDARVARIHPEDVDAVVAQLRKAIEERATAAVEYRVVVPDNDVRWVQCVGRALTTRRGGAGRMVGIARDITERKEDEARLHESEERFRAIVEQNPLGTFTIDAHGMIAGINPAAERIMGVREEDVIGRAFAEFLAPEHVETALAQFQKVLGGEVRFDTYAIHAPDGRVIRARITGIPSRERGRIVGMHGIAEVLSGA